MALKKIKFHFKGEGIPSTTIKEIGILRALNHPNIVRLLDIIHCDDQTLYLSFEYLSTDLGRYIKDNRGRFTIQNIKDLMFQIVSGVHYMHKKRVFHRDLKPDNVLIDESTSNVKIADLGLSRTFHQPFRQYSREIMTLWYRSPEASMGYKEYSIGVDCWALGCIMAQLINGTPIIRGSSDSEQLIIIFKIFGTPSFEAWPELEKMNGFSYRFPQFKGVGLRSQMKMENIDDRGFDLLEKLLILNPL